MSDTFASMPTLLPMAWIAATVLILSAIMASAWLVQRRSGQSGWIDVAWCFGLGLSAALLAFAPTGLPANPCRQALVAGLALLWSLRLGGYILLRTLRGGEDPRYRQLALEWGEAFPRRLFWFLQLQAICAALLILSVFAAAHNPSPGLRWNDGAGIFLLGLAIVGEAVSDAQLAGFRANPANASRVCADGLWARSRHPNYFFQWLGWLAYPLFALGSHYPLGWLAVTGPIFIYWLLVYVSGIPPLEAHMLRSRGDAYRAYQARVNAFFPALSTRGLLA